MLLSAMTRGAILCRHTPVVIACDDNIILQDRTERNVLRVHVESADKFLIRFGWRRIVADMIRN